MCQMTTTAAALSVPSHFHSIASRQGRLGTRRLYIDARTGLFYGFVMPSDSGGERDLTRDVVTWSRAKAVEWFLHT